MPRILLPTVRAEVGFSGFPTEFRMASQFGLSRMGPITRVHPAARSLRVHGARSAPEFAHPWPAGTLGTPTRARSPLELRLRSPLARCEPFPNWCSLSPRTVPGSTHFRAGTFATSFADSRPRPFPSGFAGQWFASGRGDRIPGFRFTGCRRSIRKVTCFWCWTPGALTGPTVLTAFGVNLVELVLGDVPIPVHIQIGKLQARSARAAWLGSSCAVWCGLSNTTHPQQGDTGEDRGDDEFDIHDFPLFCVEVRRLAPGAPTADDDSVFGLPVVAGDRPFLLPQRKPFPCKRRLWSQPHYC